MSETIKKIEYKPTITDIEKSLRELIVLLNENVNTYIKRMKEINDIPEENEFVCGADLPGENWSVSFEYGIDSSIEGSSHTVSASMKITKTKL